MAKFLVATIPVVGHVTPMLPIVEGLLNQGHEVWWYTGKLFEVRIQTTGARFVAMERGLDYSVSDNVPSTWSEQRDSLKGLAQLKFDLKHFFIEAAIGHTQDLLKILERFLADVIVADSFCVAAAWASELTGIPWAQLGISVLTLPGRDTAPFGLGLKPDASWLGWLRNQALNSLLQNVVFRDIRTWTNRARAQFALGPAQTGVFDLLSPYLYLAGTVPSFEYPRSDLPTQVHFIGPLLPKAVQDFTPPSWWEAITLDKPVIHVTQGTVATNPKDLIIPTLKALAQEEVLVIATTGSQPVEILKEFSLPNNARVEQFIPHHYLLPHVDVLITNGGYNGVQMGLAHGIPLIVAGQSEDKPEVCARVEWSGVGINLNSKTPKPERIRQALQKLLSDQVYRQNANRLQAEIKNYRAAEQAITLLENLAMIKQPILTPRTVKNSFQRG